MSKMTLEWYPQCNSNNTTTYDFGEGYQIFHDDNLKMAYKMKDGEVKDSFSVSGMLLETWNQILINFAKTITA